MIFQDAFTRADENLEANANWTRLEGTAGWGAVRSNQLACTTSDTTGAAYQCPDTGSIRHYVQGKIRNVTADSGPFLCCRLTDRNNFVGVRYNGLNGYIEAYRRNAGTLTGLGGLGPVACVMDDVIRLEVGGPDGGDYRILKNGTVVGSGNSSVIAGMPSSRCGVVMRSVVQNPWVDDFEAGSLFVALDFPSSPTTGQVYAPGDGRPGWVWNGSVWLRQPAIIGSPTAGFRNVLINADIQLSQRGNPGSGTGQRWAADRWFTNSVGTTTAPVLINPALGLEPKEGFGYLAITTTSVAGAGNFALLCQRIESVRTLAGKRCCLSFWAYAGGGVPFAVEIQQNFGTGGSPSAGVSVPLGKVTPGNVNFDKRYVIPFDMPSIVGKTIGTNGDDNVELRIWFDAGSTYAANASNLGQQSGTFYLAQLQLEEGAYATPFERRPWHVEVELCCRYYEAGIGNTIGFACPSGGGYADNFTNTFKVTKRVAPTMSHGFSGGFNYSAANSLGSTPDWCGIQLVGSALGNTGIYWTWTASAEL